MKQTCLILCLLLVILCGCGRSEPCIETGFYMDTLCRFTAYGAEADTVVADCHQRMAALDASLDHRNARSTLYALNHADGAWTELDADAFSALSVAVSMADVTRGAFDPTIGSVLTVWDDFSGNVVPTADKCAEAAALVSYRSVELDAATHSARLGNGQSVALGAIAKGYAADELVKIYRDHGCTGVVSLGGNVITVGTKPDGDPFSIGVLDPQDEAALLTTVTLTDQSAVTSGSYQRFFTVDGITYHHIFDPATGMPADSGLLSVTVFSACSAQADALSTALFVLGYTDGSALVKTLEQISVLFVLSDGEIVEVRP